MKKLMVFTAAATLAVAVSACDRTPDATTTGTGTGGTVGTTGSFGRRPRNSSKNSLRWGPRKLSSGAWRRSAPRIPT